MLAVEDKSYVSVNTCTCSLTIHYCGGTLKCLCWSLTKLSDAASVSATTTTPLLPSTSPTFTCPYPNDLVVWEYSNRDIGIRIGYPPSDGEQVLKGSGAELTLASGSAQKIELYLSGFGLLQLRLNVRQAAHVNLTITQQNLHTMHVSQQTATDSVSCMIISMLFRYAIAQNSQMTLMQTD